ncbi:MAG: epoxide hydrolase [Solirubrobacterales bacterium]
MSGAALEPFRYEAPAEALDDLRSRLAATRWPDPETVADWSQGVPLRYLRELCEHWRLEHDWRRAERRLAGLPQFRTEIDGTAIHFLHLPSPHEGALPLLLTHGWPSSVLEFLEVVEPLADPVRDGGAAADAFHVVCPSLPGFGFSAAPRRTGWGPAGIAAAWAELMSRLGYERFAAHGGDWGAAVTRSLAHVAPERLVGIHLDGDHVPRATVERLGAETEYERRALARRNEFGKRGTGYSRLQATRPQTLGAALADSPAGQCAWIVEKFAAWSDGGAEDPAGLFGPQVLLDTVTLYWLTQTAASAARIYWEAAREPTAGPAGNGVPTAVSVYPADINLASERWIAAGDPDLIRYRALERGGHFAALEVPDLFVAELRAAFAAIRERGR